MRGLREKISDMTTYSALRIGFFALKILPERFSLSLSRLLADLGFYLFSSFRKRSVKNLSLALGEGPTRQELSGIVRKSLRNFLRDFAEIGLALKSSPEKIRAEIPATGREHLDAALAKGRGVIVLSAHLGNFFLLGTRLAAEGYPTYVLVNNRRSGESQKLLDRYRLDVGQRTIPARPRSQAFRKMAEVLRQNGLAVLIADEYRSGSGIHVPFFGRTVLARRGPATLALRSGAAVVPIYLLRGAGGGLSLIIEPEMELSKSGRTKADVVENTARITRWLERTVRSYPDQWNWMNIRWQQASAPDGRIISSLHNSGVIPADPRASGRESRNPENSAQTGLPLPRQ